MKGYEWLLTEYAHEGDTARALEAARALKASGDFKLAATAYDRAYGLQPDDKSIASERAELLNQLTVTERGLTWRYVPASTFLMGSEEGDTDERPVHPVYLDEYWVMDVPISWAAYCDLMEFEPPPKGKPKNYAELQEAFYKEAQATRDYRNSGSESYRAIPDFRLTLSYCEDRTLHAVDWHAHIPGDVEWKNGKGEPIPNPFPPPPRTEAERPYEYDQKPLISVHWLTGVVLGKKLTTPAVQYRLPTEAEWEKAARGGLIQAKHAWGSAPATSENCDCNHFYDFAIQASRTYPPNGYGLYAMCGGVWEWTSDWYDSAYYAESPERNPQGSSEGWSKVWRGGSWADDPTAVTVSFRMARNNQESKYWQVGNTPIVGLRLVRTETTRS